MRTSWTRVSGVMNDQTKIAHRRFCPPPGPFEPLCKALVNNLPGAVGFGRDVRFMVSAPGDSAFMIKLAYRLSR